jgi:hypothetical protein
MNYKLFQETSAALESGIAQLEVRITNITAIKMNIEESSVLRN